MIKKIIIKIFKDPLGFVRILLFRLKLYFKWFYAFYIKKDYGVIERTRWYRDNGDENLRFKYELNSNSIVFDIGGYVGDFAYKINKKFGCKVYLFEPSLLFYKECLKKFKDNKNIFCFNYGLGNINEEFELSKDNEASSIKRKLTNEIGEKVKVRKFVDIIAEHKINRIDLIKINIEGSEFELLQHIIDENLLFKINNIQVQFHHFVPDAIKKRENIISSLKKTHKNDWSYYFVWENWSLK